MAIRLNGISSMATRKLLAELAAEHLRRRGVEVHFESVGGVDAARRVEAGENFDLVVLASDVIERLIAGGHLLAGSRVDLVRSEIAIAVRSGADAPQVDSEAALRAAVLAAPSISFSTGPSGQHLARLFQRWGLADEVKAKTVVAPAGVPVGSLVARGDAALGFQQRSELQGLQGIQLLGTLPPGADFITTFSAAIGVRSTQAGAASALLAFMAGPEASAAKQGQGMAPA